MSKNINVKKDDHMQQWEATEFPLVCETCLGDNPYVRMTKEKFGKRCKVCDVPFTVFAWQAGTKGRLKKVEICRSCAKTKNVCQVCVFDLQYGLPVGVRDSILAEETAATNKNCKSEAMAMVPMSDANRSWNNALITSQSEQQQQPSISVKAAMKLQSMARMEPRYERNLPKICSFFVRGECNRGSLCPFRHELSQVKDRNDPLAKQNTKDRFYGSQDPVAQKMLNTRKQKEEERRKNNANNQEDERSPTTLFIKFTTTDIKLSQAEIRDAMYSYGEIVKVQVFPNHAFVEYTTEQAAELAMVQVKHIANTPVLLRWARQAKRGVHQQLNASAVAPPLLSNQSIAHKFKPSAEVAAIVARKKNDIDKSNINTPLPGGGPIKSNNRRNAAPTIRSRPTPYTYYPSADPSRLGARSANS